MFRDQNSEKYNLKYFQNANATPTPGSPTSRLLLEYEMHLRNTLAKGMDAESYSLHTFEALLTQSLENLGKPQLVYFLYSIFIFYLRLKNNVIILLGTTYF